MGKYDIDWNLYADISRRAAAEGAVLLKNDNKALPIKKGETASVFGRIQLDYYKSGTGSGGMVNTRYVVGILDALKNCKDISINKDLLGIYEEWVKEHPCNRGIHWGEEPWSQEEMSLTDEVVSNAASNSDLAVVIIGRTAGEDKDSSAEKGSYLLTDLEEDMLQKVCKAFKRVAVVLNVGNIIDMKWVDTYNPSAVLYAWHGGQEGGNSVLDVLTGEVTPCGKLSDTIAYNIEDYPSTAYFGDKKRNFYAEDIFVGYRYFETVAKDKVMYPFGFGLSYTTFETENILFEAPKFAGQVSDYHLQSDKLGMVNISVKVTNTGDVKGKEVVQAYLSAPQGKLGKASRELKAFGKTAELEPGLNETIELSISVKDIASYDDSGVTGHKSCYVLEAGKYEFYVGTDVRSAALGGTLEIPELIVVEELEEAVAPKIPYERLHANETAAGVELVNEATPLRTIDLQKRIIDGRPEEIPYTGDKGYKLGDVFDNKISLDEFLAQLSDEDLIHMSRGEGMSSPKVTPGTAGAFGGVTDNLHGFGIPVGCCADGPSGIRMDCGTYAFSMPNGTCLACSFNTELVKELYVMEGKELRKNRVDTLLGPGLNIHRNPLNGRNFEYFSEDPLLTGKMAVACLSGMHEFGVTGTIKHFAGNNQEFGRNESDSVISERALREIYLKGFEIAVKEGKARSVMSTYGALNGIWTAGNYDLLTTILRKEWGFKGIVMTDWWAKMNEDGEETAAHTNTQYMVRAQNDLYMVVENAAKNTGNDILEESFNNGVVTRGELMRNAANICYMLMNSPVMERFLGRMSEEEKAASENAQNEDNIAFDLAYQRIEDDTLLDLTGLKTGRGDTTMFALNFAKRGLYDISLKVKSDSGELAQMPVTISVDRSIVSMITINGTNGEWINVTRDLGVIFNQNCYLKIYFAQGGLEVSEIRISIREEIDLKKIMEEKTKEEDNE